MALLVFGLIGWSIAVLSVMAAWDWRNRYEGLRRPIAAEVPGTVEFGESNVALTAARLREMQIAAPVGGRTDRELREAPLAARQSTGNELREAAIAAQSDTRFPASAKTFDPW
jgi:hypothetical protein